MATNDSWLAQVQEETIDPGAPICHPHHHLWDRREGRVEQRYLLDEILRDLQSGHNVVSTVFIEHLAMFRAEEMIALGGAIRLVETEGKREIANESEFELKDAVLLESTGAGKRREWSLGTIKSGTCSFSLVSASSPRPTVSTS